MFEFVHNANSTPDLLFECYVTIARPDWGESRAPRTGTIEGDRGPVMVTVEYTIDPADRDAFLAALDHVGVERRRDGAYAWGVFEDTADPSHYVETFLVESWLEHLRQHERVTHADREVQDRATRFQRGGPTKVTHMFAAERGERES